MAEPFGDATPSGDATVHPTAIVEDGARIGAGSTVGPFCHLGPQVVLGEGCQLVSHAVVAGDTQLDANCRVFPFASLGHEPQDLKYRGEPVRLRIGARCTFREGVTVNPGTVGGTSQTTIGDDCTLLANAHVAHDCTLGNRVVFSNNVMLAGHCTVGDGVIFGGGAAAHQFCRIGRLAFVGGIAGVEGDVIPFGMALGNRAYLGGLNLVGLKRAGAERASIHALRAAYRDLFSGAAPVAENAERLRESATDPAVLDVLDFIAQGGGRALCTPR